jgi:hypothetical protein
MIMFAPARLLGASMKIRGGSMRCEQTEKTLSEVVSPVCRKQESFAG